MFPLKPFVIALVLLMISALGWADEPPEAGESTYQLGKGWKFAGTGLSLGGYTSVAVESDHRRSKKLGIDDFSVFLHWENDGKIRFFSEWDMENPLAWEQGQGITAKHLYLALERIYVDYLYSEKVNVRAGKFLTPIGRWNVVHAAPLVWTTSRPLVTEHTFPSNATGAMVYGTLPAFGTQVDYSLYAALGDDWRTDPKLDPFEEAYGLHLMLPLSHLGELGFSYSNFEQRGAIGERRNLLGLDYFVTRNRYELNAEWAYRFSDDDHSASEKGLFVQGVAPLSERWYAIARYEMYDKAGADRPTNLWLGGVAMRLSPAMLLKAEVSQATHNRIQAQEGFFASFAVLF